MGGKFTVTQPVCLQQQNGNPIIVVGDAKADRDDLTGVPVI
jgi:hypothetical protein